MSGDLIRRQEAIDIIENYPHGEWNVETMNDVISKIKSLSSAEPTYTDEQIQKMQDLEQAQLDKAFELGREDAKAEIIRCKDCVAYGEMLTGRDTRMICHKFALNFPRDFYCADAERRTDG